MASVSSVPVTVVLDLAKLGITNPTFSQSWGTVQMKLTQLTIRGSIKVGTSVVSGTSSAPEAPPVPVTPPPPPPPPPAPPTESAHGSTIPPFTQLVDSVGAVWTVTDGVVYRDNVQTISSNVTLLLYYSSIIYQQNSAGSWWRWQGGSQGQWVATTDPRATTSGTAPSPMPTITVERHPKDLLQVGAVGTRTYRVEDNRWGVNIGTGIAEGTGSSQYQQEVGRQLTVGPFGEVAWRTTWRYPQFVNGVSTETSNFSEVKAYPEIIYGAKPGHDSSPPERWPAWDFAVRLPDGVTVPTAPAGTPNQIAADWQPLGGSVSSVIPSGPTPGTHLPVQLPITAGSFTTAGRYSVSATGKGHLAFEVWLQQETAQRHGFVNAPITHEIMIPLRSWGGYGEVGNRNPAWWDHTVTIDGVSYTVYCTKGGDGALRYDFSFLNGNYTNEETGQPRTGWKFIIFQHNNGSTHPLQADGSFRIDVKKFLDHLATRNDSRGISFIRNSEYLVVSTLGVEMVYGQGDLTVWDYRARS